MASDTFGNFVVIWQSPQDPLNGVFGQRYDASGAPVGSEFRVNTYTTSTQNMASVAADSSGDFVVAWTSAGQDGSSFGVFGQRYASSGTPVGPEFRVNTYATGSQTYPSVAADSSGNFVVVWTSSGQDGSSRGIFAQRYDSAGTPLAPEFRVNTYTPDSQTYPSIAADTTGNFVVAWGSFAQDGSGYGVFAQRYGRIVPVELTHFGIE